MLFLRKMSKSLSKKKNFNQIDKNENNISKQLTEIRHNKHKKYLQSKTQSNKEEHRDVHQRSKVITAIIGDSMVSGLKEQLLSNKKHQVKVKGCRSATVEDMFDYVKPISKS